MAVRLRVRVGRLVVMAVTVVVVVTVVVTVYSPMTIRTSLGLEGCAYGGHPRAEPMRHVRDDVVGTDPEHAGQELGWEVPVPEVPCDPEQEEGVVAGDLEQVFGRTLDHHHAPVLELERVTVRECLGLGEVQEECEAVFTVHGHAPPVPVVVVQTYPVGGLARPFAGGNHARGAWKGGSRHVCAPCVQNQKRK